MIPQTLTDAFSKLCEQTKAAEAAKAEAERIKVETEAAFELAVGAAAADMIAKLPEKLIERLTVELCHQLGWRLE